VFSDWLLGSRSKVLASGKLSCAPLAEFPLHAVLVRCVPAGGVVEAGADAEPSSSAVRRSQNFWNACQEVCQMPPMRTHSKRTPRTPGQRQRWQVDG
jgi:hypothetical protein